MLSQDCQFSLSDYILPKITKFKKKHLITQRIIILFCNFSYNVCIRQANGFSCIQYTACSDTNSFAISEATIASSSMLGTACTADWVNIGSSGPCDQPTTVDQFCGAVLNTALNGAVATMSVDAAICGNMQFQYT